MYNHRFLSGFRRLLFPVLLTAAWASSSPAGDKPLTFVDLMKFRTLEDASISRDGRWIAYGLDPDRGDGEAVVRSTEDAVEYRIERGAKPLLSADGRWAAAEVVPPFAEREKAGDDKDKDKDKDKPEKGLAILDLADGAEERIEEVESFAFSEDGRWLAYQRVREDEDAKEGEQEVPSETAEKPEPKEPEPKEPEPKEEEEQEEETDDDKLGSTLVLRDLSSGEEIALDHVSGFAFDKASAFLAYGVSAPEGKGNGAFVRRLGEPGAPETALHRLDRGRYTHLTWSRGTRPRETRSRETRSRGPATSLLAFVAAVVEDGKAGDGTVWIWEGEGEPRPAASRQEAPEGWTVPSVNELRWSRDGRRLFLGFRPIDPSKEEDASSDPGDAQGEAEDEAAFDPYDVEALLAEREVDVWHWNDPLIQPNQKKIWKNEQDRTYRAVFHREASRPKSSRPGPIRVVPLADLEMRHVEPSENPRFALAGADAPYFKERTWVGQLFDLYVVDLESGRRHLVAQRLDEDFAISLSPGGRYVVYYAYGRAGGEGRADQGHWYLYDTESHETRNVTAGLEVPFADEDHDYPRPPADYGMAEWLRDESAVLIYDKYDVWRVPTGGGGPVNLTGGEGREKGYSFRVLDLDPEEDTIAPGSPLLLRAFHHRLKHYGFYAARADGAAVRRLYEPGERVVSFVARSREADRILFSRESFSEFPDLWVADLGEDNGSFELGRPRKLSDANPQIADFAWGEAELVEWQSLDGVPLQGALLKPGNYEPGQRYPVLVYYYRFFSQRVHEFNEPVINHRPSFPIYTSNGYAVFLPDIRFDVGQPGFSATKCLVPGVQKLIDMDIADPDAVGLHGHSWSGYQTAFVITQTDLFKAAVAGAPVSNMTSAYSGIRGGTGLARQFQYEMSQSRIGGSLWDYRERYIENSPVFFADRIETPLLIQFGDEDEAVPWQQGIELYLALRRLGKDCIFLQYRGEPHHLKKYPNKLDYSIKMKEFFDHHLKGAPAPEWMTEGVPFKGE